MPLGFHIEKFTTATVHALSIAVRESPATGKIKSKKIKGLACIIDKRFLILIKEETSDNIELLGQVVYGLFLDETASTISKYYKVMPQDRVDDMLREVECFVYETVALWVSAWNSENQIH